MLLQREIKHFIKANHIYNLLKLIPTAFDGSAKRLCLNITIDLTKTIRQQQQIGLFIIGNYYKFVQLFEESVSQTMLDHNISIPENGVSISFNLSNCPLLKHNFESVQFLSAAFEQKDGVLVYIMEGHVINVKQQQFYLSSWQQIWGTTCKCSTQRIEISKRQGLIDIIKSQSKNIRTPINVQPHRCQQCSSKMNLLCIKDQHFVDCQKITILMNVDHCQSNLLNSQDIFHRGEFHVYLDQSHTGKLTQGDIIDLCCYYTGYQEIIKLEGQKMILKPSSSFYMICFYPASNLSSGSSTFLTRLVGLECEYIRCRDAQDLETICYNYKNLLKTINLINFPYAGQNNLSTLKLLLVNSLFSHINRIKLHVLVLTDQVALFENIFHLLGLTIKKWPSLYDQTTINKFINTCHHAIIIVSNPNKKDWEQLNHILNGQQYHQLNFTLWIISEPINNFKKELNLEKIPIVMDLTSQKNLNVCRSIYDTMIDEKLQRFINKEEIINTVQKGKRGKDKVMHQYQGVFEGIESNQEEEREQDRIARQLLQKYFIKARQYKHIGSASLENIQNIAQGFSFFRYFLKSKGNLTPAKHLINILDSILAIFIEQQTSRNKISVSNTLFSNEISKLLLNEGDCELSFWELEVDENQEIGQRKKMIKKQDMFKRMIQKLMMLLYGEEMI